MDQDITKPPRPSNPKVSAIVDVIVNNGEPSTPPSVRSSEPWTLPPVPKKMKMMMTPSVKDRLPLKEVAPKKVAPLNLAALEIDDDEEESDDAESSDNSTDTDKPDKIRVNINDLPVVGDDTSDDKYNIDDLPPPRRQQKDADDEVDEDDADEQKDEDAEKAEDAIDERDGGGTIEDKITETVDYLTLHDVSKVGKLLDVFEKEEALEGDVTLLRKLTEEWMKNERQGKEPALGDIEKILKELKMSTIPKSKLVELSMLLKDIRRNRNRVSDILRRMSVILEDEHVCKEDLSWGLKNLIQEQLISEEQYRQLVGMIDDLDIDKVITVIKSTKIGRGVDFLPRQTKQLHHKLYEWTNDHHEEATSDLKKKIVAALRELLCRKAISKQHFEYVMESLQ